MRLSHNDLAELLRGGYQPDQYRLWDPWILEVDGQYWLFHLQLPKDYSIKEFVPENLQAHSEKVLDYHSSIGIARSEDLSNWQRVGTALERGEEGAWDDLALWTGCAIEGDDGYYLFYTGRNSERFWEQKIGMAYSHDLINWRKNPENPILTADAKYYGTTTELNKIGAPPAWRDPFVFWDETSEKYHMLISARTKHGSTYNACVGHAVSTNLKDWQVLPPILELPGFDQIENPQMRLFAGHYYLFLSIRKKALKPQKEEVMKLDAGLYGFWSDSLDGTFQPVNGNGIIVPKGEQIYSIQVIPWKQNKFAALGWYQLNEKGEYVCRMAQPFALEITQDKVDITRYN